MAKDFDPYHVWLGIPPDEQPPNHYRLLGVRPFEPNPDVIDNQADQRMTHLRAMQTGKNAALSQKLLNEVAAARICLLNPATRQQYDQKLRAGSPPVPKAATVPVSIPASAAIQPQLSRDALRRTPAASMATAANPSAEVVPSAPAVRSNPSPSWKKRTGPLVVAAVGLMAVVAVIVAYILINRSENESSGDGHPNIAQTNVPQPSVAQPNVAQHQNPDPAKGDMKPVVTPDVSPVAKPESEPAFMKLRVKWPLIERNGGQLTIDGQVKPLDAANLEFPLPLGQHVVRIVRPGFRTQVKTIEITAAEAPPLVPRWIPSAPPPAVAVKPVEPNARQVAVTPAPTPRPGPTTTPKPAATTAPDTEISPDKPTAKSDEKPAKTAVPDEAAQAKALKNVQDIYRDELKRATTPDQKLALAKKLLAEGLATAGDPAGRFVLLKMARDMTAAQGDLDAATGIVDKLADEYDVGRLEMKSDVLLAAAKSPARPDEYSAKLNALADEAIAADRFDLAKRAIAAAIKLKVEPALHKQSVAHQKEVGEIEGDFRRLKTSRDALEANPDDPDANLAVGKFDCLVKGNFSDGLPLLAKGSDKTLAELAKLDLAQSVDATEQVAVADGWWETGKRPAQMRAKEIYEGALPRLSGIVRTKVEKRIQEFETKGGIDVWTNLLKLVEPDKAVNAAYGRWTQGADGLQCTSTLYANAIVVPFDPGANYEVKLEFTRLTGTTGDIALYLPVGADHFRVVLGAQGRYGGIDTIEGHELYDRLNPTVRPAKLENNVRCQVDVAVRTNGPAIEVFVRVNGMNYTSFRGQLSQLGLSNTARLPVAAQANTLGLGAQSSTAIFHSLQYRKLPPPLGR